MVQLQRMDARLDTFSMKFYQVNVCVGRIARWQASIGGFAPEVTPSPPSPMASESEDDDDDASDDADGNTTLSSFLNTKHTREIKDRKDNIL